MVDVAELQGEQARQFIDVEQVFEAYVGARAELKRRYAGAMSWKSIGERDYLYRKSDRTWTALGPRTPERERTYASFHEGRARAKDRVSGLAARLDEMAPVNRALKIGRMPLIAARVLRALGQAKLIGTAIDVVGTHALYAYERLAGVFIAGGHLATGDVDLLYDTRARLRLLGTDVAVSGLAGLLQKVDRSFAVTDAGSFRAVNRDGFMVDLIQPPPKNRMTSHTRNRIGTAETDLKAVEIEGLAWLVNSPKVETVVIDVRGYPLSLVTPDPRSFALHKLWLADRPDRDSLKRRRDSAQGRLVAQLLTTRLPHLRFDDPALGALPKALRDRAVGLTTEPGQHERLEEAREPGW